jgi:putative ABC transport system permease protein
LRAPLFAGRAFTAQDDAAAPKVAIVNEAFVHSFLPHAYPVGRHVFLYIDKNAPFEIVGVVKNARYSSALTDPIPSEIYVPFSQWTDMPPESLALELRTSGPAMPGLVRGIGDALGSINRYATFTVAPMDALLKDSVQRQRTMATLSAGFGFSALGLAVIGLFGVLTYIVNRKVHEIGIRLALGAQPREILRTVIWDGITMVLAGIAGGTAASLALTRFVSSLLFEIKPTDPLSFIGGPVLLLLVALLASYLPARRAMRVDPMLALRYE